MKIKDESKRVSFAKSNVVAVFGGSRCEVGSAEFEEAKLLGTRLVGAGLEVVTGGYSGVMEAVSMGVAKAGGDAHAITLRAWGPPNEYVSKFNEASDLFERQRLLVENADAFIALYGGPGTLSEVSLVWALNQSTLMKPPRPLILVGKRWKKVVVAWSKFLHVNQEDLTFLTLVDNVDDGVRLVTDFLAAANFAI